MSENQLPPPQPTQAPPPASTPPPPQRTPALSSAADLQLRHESLSSPPPQTPQSSPQSPPAGGIEKRHILSPVSPRPVHVAESAALKNQMELAFTFPDAHPPHPPATSNDRSAVSPVSNSLESLMLQRQQQLHAPQLQQNHQQNPQHVPSPPPRSQQQPPQQGEAPSHANSAALVPAMDSSSSNSCTSLSFAQNGDVHAGDGLVASSPATTNGTAAGNPANTATAGLPLPSPIPDDFASSVDLQALLTKLSPAAPTVPQLLSSAPPAQSPPPTGPSVVASPSSAPSTIKAALPLSPVQKTPTPAPPTNHPLPPVPVVSSSLPGQPPAGYPSSLPPPPNFNHNKQSQSQSQPQPQPPQPQQAPQPQRQGSDAAAEDEEDEEDRLPFTVDEEEEFSRFLSDERDYVTQGQWDRFPAGSRLFIGNLPTEKVTKRDLFRIFHKHGRLAQISIKQAYGFVQFLDQSSCASALRHEQGSSVRGRKMHLEISKPQRNTRPAPTDSARPRRSRSPDYARGGGSPRRSAPPAAAGRREVDRYRAPPPSDRDHRDRRDRDEYSARRRSSPPPLRGARDDYRPGRRSRSRSPPTRYRPRSRSRTRSPDFDDVPLPRRAPEQVPEVQILVSDELDRNFIWWVEQAFRQRGLTCDMLFLNPRLQLSAVVKRQVLEGVHAVVFLNRSMQAASKISIQVFDRRGEGEASFDQYDSLDPPIAAELVVRSKQSYQQHNAAPLAQYGGAYGVPPAQQQPLQQQLGALAGVPGLANLLTSLDAGSLQKLLAGLQQPQQPVPQVPYQQQHQHQQSPQLGADLASLIAGAVRPQQPTPQQQQPPQQQQYGGQSALSAFGGSAGLAALLGQAQQKVAAQQQQQQQQHQQQQSHSSAGQIGNIMETLAKWKQA